MGFFLRCDWEPICNFERAKAAYERVTPVKFRCVDRAKVYGTDCRPLGARRNYERYITKTKPEELQNEIQAEGTGISTVSAFDLVLYQTVMVRYFSDGRVSICPDGLPRAYNTLSSANFLYYCLPSKYTAWMEAGRVVVFDGSPSTATTTRTFIPETWGLDIVDGVLTNPQPIHRLTLNRKVTKLHRERIETVIQEAFALAAIMDGCDSSEFLRNSETTTTDAMTTPEGIFNWMVRQFSFRDWGNLYVNPNGSLTRRPASRAFNMPSRSEFNKQFYPRLYWAIEHSRDIEKDPSLFEVTPYPSAKYLRASPRWYGLHSKDPRHETHPNII